MAVKTKPPSTSESIISDTLGRAPDIQIGSQDQGFTLSRWRQFVGAYSLPAMPDPLFVVHISGKPNVKTWKRDGWSENRSVPGLATIVPSGQATGWLVDGELDVVTLSVSPSRLENASAAEQFHQMKFAFSDPLGVALTRQILGEIYQPQSEERQAYVGTLVSALKAHVLRVGRAEPLNRVPIAAFSAHRIHTVMNAILTQPEKPHALDDLAAQAGITTPHFCRVFKRASGMTPHQYVMKAKLDRARLMLESSDMPVAQISDYLGFTSQSHFTRAFKQHLGDTPGDFRADALRRPAK